MNLNIQQLMLGIASGVISFHFHRIVEKMSLYDCPILYGPYSMAYTRSTYLDF